MTTVIQIRNAPVPIARAKDSDARPNFSWSIEMRGISRLRAPIGASRRSLFLATSHLGIILGSPVVGQQMIEHIVNGDHTEQSLLWGHPFHPSPKSRSGVQAEQLLLCSPEVGAAFQLHWFEINPVLLKELGSPVIDKVSETLTGRTGLYPCHPWEVELVLQSGIYQQASQNKLIRHLGPLGKVVWPTSSVRTLYHPELDVFLKCSIHVRLTNCIRKNAWYELESAVGMTQLLAHTFEQVEHAHPGFRMLREPAASTIDLSQADATASHDDVGTFRSQTGVQDAFLQCLCCKRTENVFGCVACEFKAMKY